MFVYQSTIRTPPLFTNGFPNTETDAFAITAGDRDVSLMSLQLQGTGATLTTLSGIVIRHCVFATASSGGTSTACWPIDPGLQVHTAALSFRPTAGSTRTNHHVSGMGCAGPGGFVAEYPCCMMTLPGGSAASIDAMDSSGAVSLNYDCSLKFVE